MNASRGSAYDMREVDQGMRQRYTEFELDIVLGLISGFLPYLFK